MATLPTKQPREQIAIAPASVAWLRLGVAGGALIALYLVVQLIWLALSAALGVAALAAIGVAAIALFQTLPLLAQKWENRLLALRKAEARANPIEQLLNYLAAKTQQVDTFRKAVSIIGTQIKALSDMVEDRRRTGRDVSKQEASIAQMKTAHQALLAKYQAAANALVHLRETIDDKKFEFAFAQQGQAAMATLNATSGKDILDAMLADEAFSAVRDNFNQVFSDLETEAARLNATRQMEYGGVRIDISAMPQIPEAVGAP